MSYYLLADTIQHCTKQELEWRFGYPVVIVVSITIAVACLLFFKRKKWL